MARQFANFWYASAFGIWEPVDPVVADPVAQDNDKRNNIQIDMELPYESTHREGAKYPNVHSLPLSCRTGFPDNYQGHVNHEVHILN